MAALMCRAVPAAYLVTALAVVAGSGLRLSSVAPFLLVLVGGFIGTWPWALRARSASRHDPAAAPSELDRKA